MDEIKQFSLELANNSVDWSIEEYFKMLNNEFYKSENIDFMGYFLELVHKHNDFCIEQVKLQEYKVLNTLRSSDILRILNKLDLKEKEDYILCNVAKSFSSGTKYKKEYFLKPRAFKLCLIRAKNSTIYAKDYINYEEMYHYYKYYKTECQNKVLLIKDDKIEELTKKIEELLNYGKKTIKKLYEEKEDLNDMSEEFENINEQFDDFYEKVDYIKYIFEETTNSSVPDPEKKTDKSEYILLQNKEYLNKFIFIRGIKEYNDKKMINRYNEDYEIVTREFNSNPNELFKLFKKIVKDELKEVKDSIKNNNNLKGQKLRLKREAEKIKISNNKNSNQIELLNNFTMGQLLDKIKEIAEIKFEKYNESK